MLTNKCVFNKNHKMNCPLLNHYIKCHLDEYNNCMKNGWYCEKINTRIFPTKIRKEKHDAKCEYCQAKKNKKNIFEDSISIAGHQIIEEKMPKDKKQINLPIFDFDQFIIKDDNKFIKDEDYKKEIEEEKNILY